MSEVEVTSNNLLKTAAGVIPHEYGIREDGVRWTAYRPYIAPDLTKDNIGGIIHLIIADLNRRLEDKQLTIRLSEEAMQYIVDNAYDPVYGARPLKRYIQKYVETLAAKMILADQVEEGDTIVITVENDQLAAKCEKGSKNQ